VKYTDELRNIAHDASMSAGTRTRLHAIAHDIDIEIKRLRELSDDALGAMLKTKCAYCNAAFVKAARKRRKEIAV
jgi:hypothetical protein